MTALRLGQDFHPRLNRKEFRVCRQLLSRQVLKDGQRQDRPTSQLQLHFLSGQFRGTPQITGQHPLHHQDMLYRLGTTPRLTHLRYIENQVVAVLIVHQRLARHVKETPTNGIDTDGTDGLAPRTHLQIMSPKHLHLPKPHKQKDKCQDDDYHAEKATPLHDR